MHNCIILNIENEIKLCTNDSAIINFLKELTYLFLKSWYLIFKKKFYYFKNLEFFYTISTSYYWFYLNLFIFNITLTNIYKIQ